jgi:hypothetical protein
MEFASLQDAFPQLDTSKEKRSRKQKEGFQAYELPPTDPDRPAVKRMMEIPPVGKEVPNDPTDINSYLDESTIFQNKPTVNNSLPSPKTLKKMETPSFFGAEPFSNPAEDTMALYNGHVNNPNGYMLEADFTKSFEQSGFGKSSGSEIPIPELRQRWKPLSADRVGTAFTNTGKGSQFHGLSTDDIKAMHLKIDSLMARLDDIENRAEGANPQLEMLSFIMTGLFLMFVLDLAVKRSGK